MKVYLAHAKANYASPRDGYVNAMRAADYPLTLYSFHFLQGLQTLPIGNEDLHGSEHEPVVDEYRIRAQSSRG